MIWTRRSVRCRAKPRAGAAYGCTKELGYRSLLAFRADTGEVVGVRLREGSSQRGVVHFAKETIGRIRRAGAWGRVTIRADSGFWSYAMLAALALEPARVPGADAGGRERIAGRARRPEPWTAPAGRRRHRYGSRTNRRGLSTIVTVSRGRIGLPGPVVTSAGDRSVRTQATGVMLARADGGEPAPSSSSSPPLVSGSPAGNRRVRTQAAGMTLAGRLRR